MSQALPPPGQGRLATPLATPLSRTQVTGGIQPPVGQAQTQFSFPSHGTALQPGTAQTRPSGSLQVPVAGTSQLSSPIRSQASSAQQQAARSSPLVTSASRSAGRAYQAEASNAPVASGPPMGSSSLLAPSTLTSRRSASPLVNQLSGDSLLGNSTAPKAAGASTSSLSFPGPLSSPTMTTRRIATGPPSSLQSENERVLRQASGDLEAIAGAPSRLSTSLAEPSLGLPSTPGSTTTSLSVSGYPASSNAGRSAVAPSLSPLSGVGTSLGSGALSSSLGPSRTTDLPDTALEEFSDPRQAPPRPFRAPPPFYWVPTPASIGEFEVSGACGEVVTKIGDYQGENSALPIAGTLRMAKGGLYIWTLQVVRQSPHRPNIQFGVQGAGHARPWRLVSSGRCSRSRDEGPWVARPGGDKVVSEGDFLHCEADFRGLDGPIGSFAYAINNGAFETAFEDIPLTDGPLFPVVSMGGDGTTCRLCGDS